ncbi:MAG TPA: hypothetical protein ENJ97_06745, partial [Planctomycetes bacterium]|nr:hypothetical protein [Planctomycetota bacterium]
PAGAGRAYFAADDGTHGRELWVTDGTSKGTRLAADVRKSSLSSNPYELVLSGGNLLFKADDGIKGLELWALFPGATAQPIGRPAALLPPVPGLTATDPVLGGSCTVAVENQAKGTSVVLFLGLQGLPLSMGPAGWIHLNAGRILLPFTLAPSRSFSIPAVPALTGTHALVQAFQFPTGLAPLGADWTQAILLTPGL